MTIREQAIKEIQEAAEEVVREALDFLRFLQSRERARKHPTAVASEAVLARDWASPDEESAWEDL